MNAIDNTSDAHWCAALQVGDTVIVSGRGIYYGVSRWLGTVTRADTASQLTVMSPLGSYTFWKKDGERIGRTRHGCSYRLEQATETSIAEVRRDALCDIIITWARRVKLSVLNRLTVEDAQNIVDTLTRTGILDSTEDSDE